MRDPRRQVPASQFRYQREIPHHAARAAGGRRAATVMMVFTGVVTAVAAVELSGGAPGANQPVAAAPPAVQVPRPQMLTSAPGVPGPPALQLSPTPAHSAAVAPDRHQVQAPATHHRSAPTPAPSPRPRQTSAPALPSPQQPVVENSPDPPSASPSGSASSGSGSLLDEVLGVLSGLVR